MLYWYLYPPARCSIVVASQADKAETVAILAASTGTLLVAAEAATPAAGTVPVLAAEAADWAAANLVDKGMKVAARTPTRSVPAAYTRPEPGQRRLAVRPSVALVAEVRRRLAGPRALRPNRVVVASQPPPRPARPAPAPTPPHFLAATDTHGLPCHRL